MEFKKIQTIAFFAILIGIGVVFYHLIAPYLFAIFWAAILASVFYPVYKRINRALGNRENISSTLTLLLVILVVVLPLAGVVSLVVRQAIDAYAQITDPQTLGTIQDLVNRVLAYPSVIKLTEGVDVQSKLQNFSSSAGSVVIQWVKVGSQNTVALVIQLFIMLYCLYYFLKEGEGWLKHIMHLLPFGDKNEEVLYERFASTGKATLKGTIFIGGIQGTIGGLFFFIAGIPSAAFWGLVMIVLSIIPAAGAGIVTVPGIIYLLVIGHYWQAFVLLGGLIVVGTVDNLLRPKLVGKDIEMHPVLILLSTIGGLSLFGISGVIAGPIIAAFFMALIQMYELKYKKQLDSSQT